MFFQFNTCHSQMNSMNAMPKNMLYFLSTEMILNLYSLAMGFIKNKTTNQIHTHTQIYIYMYIYIYVNIICHVHIFVCINTLWKCCWRWSEKHWTPSHRQLHLQETQNSSTLATHTLIRPQRICCKELRKTTKILAGKWPLGAVPANSFGSLVASQLLLGLEGQNYLLRFGPFLLFLTGGLGALDLIDFTGKVISISI